MSHAIAFSEEIFMGKKSALVVAAVLTIVSGTWCASAQPQESNPSTSAPIQQTETDEYTRYELLAPESSSFKITYEVTATTAGAKFFYNPIRKGSVASDEQVIDAARGTNSIKVTLARPVPEKGQGRIIILKTYADPKSYFTDDKGIVFDRPL